MILKPRPNDRKDMEECRAVWAETKDPAKAVEKLDRRKCPERFVNEERSTGRWGQPERVIMALRVGSAGVYMLDT